MLSSDPLAYRSPRVVEQDCPGGINGGEKGSEHKDLEQRADDTLDILFACWLTRFLGYAMEKWVEGGR